MRPVLLLALLSACATTSTNTDCPAPPTAASVDVPGATTDLAVAALRAAQFDKAVDLASTVLKRSPKDAVAHAVRALATEVRIGERFRGDVMLLVFWIDSGMTVHDYFRWELGRLDELLASVDRDLAAASDNPDFALELCLACWERDWNGNGRVDSRDRHLFEVELDGNGQRLPEDSPLRRPTFRFDVGDLHWGRAMVSFQRAVVNLLLAHRWEDFAVRERLEKLFDHKDPLTAKLVEPERLKRAHRLVLDALAESDAARVAYLAENDDDREWVPSPHQKSHAIPLPVDDPLYETWRDVVADLVQLVQGDTQLAYGDLARLTGELDPLQLTGGLDLKRLVFAPRDLTFDPNLYMAAIEARGKVSETWAKDMFGAAYVPVTNASKLPSRLARMKRELEMSTDSLEKKLRYLLWVN